MEWIQAVAGGAIGGIISALLIRVLLSTSKVESLPKFNYEPQVVRRSDEILAEEEERENAD